MRTVATMRPLCLLLCIACASCYYTDINPSGKERIAGGAVPKEVDVAYHASLYYLRKLFCGAAIIAERWLLSAEVCFLDKTDIENNVLAKTGTKCKEQDPFCPLFPVKSLIKYSDDFPDSDVLINLALLLLDDALKISAAQKPVPLAKTNQAPPAGSDMKISGFGKTHPSSMHTSVQMREASVKVLSAEECPEAANRHLFCAENHRGDACDCDEGGPGVIGETLFAIITGRPKCRAGNSRGVYTKVGAFYYWICKTAGIPL